MQDHLDGLAAEEDAALLAANAPLWADSLGRLLAELDQTLGRLRATVHGPERELVLADFEEERERILGQLAELGHAPADGGAGSPRGRREETPVVQAEVPAVPRPPGTVQLQLTFAEGQVLAWAAGEGTEAEDRDAVLTRLEKAGAGREVWTEHAPVTLPGGVTAPAVSAPFAVTLGWLVSVGAGDADPDLAPSATWLGRAAATAVRMVAQGRMVPQLSKEAPGKGGDARFRVTWEPALIDEDVLQSLTQAMPGAVAALEKRPDATATTRAVLGACIDLICGDAAGRIEVPAAPPRPRSASDTAETFLARMNGTPFDGPANHGGELARDLRRWARSVLGVNQQRLVVELRPPDSSEAWHLRTLTATGRRKFEPVDGAMSKMSEGKREHVKAELDRLETLYQPLLRVKGERRGEVLLGQDEAWELMTEIGPRLVAAGFDVRVPPLRTKKATPGLKLTSFGSEGEAAVGSRQLTAVQWSAVFDDVELTVEDIRRLAGESRPLVKSHGRWVEVDKADLEAAAAALAERAEQKELTGAQMLRYALGLEDAPLPGGVQLDGTGWASDLLRAATSIPEEPPTELDGFEGRLRTYQADAVAWLEFLHGAGLGGCLALDMGLGKTPTLLAHLRATRPADGTPDLVIAPPAVVGNWASEAKRFVPDLRVVVHHGQNRADVADFATAFHGADLVITTYGTAVRDVDGLADMDWGKVVLDEAQVIKNPASETAQQLRRLEAHTRIVLTGTPIENGLGDLWALMDFVNPGLVGDRATFVAQLGKVREGSGSAEQALRTLNGVLVFRRTKSEPAIAAELPDRIDELDHCPMTPEQIGLYQAVLDELVLEQESDGETRKGAVLAAITALKQICNHPAAYTGEEGPLAGRSGKLARLEEILESVFESGERALIFTHFASWGERLSTHLSERFGMPISCYHGGLARGARDRMVAEFQAGEGPGALVLSLKAGGTGLNLTAASHVVLYDRWWNPAVEDQARDRAWRIGQTRMVISHRLVCPGTVDERVEEVVAGKRRIANMVLPESSTVGDLDAAQLRAALGIDESALLTEEDLDTTSTGDAA
ncbi:MAG: SNF2-related protein [Actinomycetes bacterium]